MLISDPYTRLLLQRYAGEQPPLTMMEFKKMVELLGFHSLPLQNLVKSFGTSTCPPPYVPFLKSLALDSPICGMFHPSINLRQTLIEMREKDPKTSLKLLEDLQMQLPLVNSLFQLKTKKQEAHRPQQSPKYHSPYTSRCLIFQSIFKVQLQICSNLNMSLK